MIGGILGCRDKQSLKRKYAVVAQLVEHHLAKVDVASSSLVNRSTESPEVRLGAFALLAEVTRLFGVVAGLQKRNLRM